MIKISRYFTIPFDDPAISLDSLIAFSTDHLQRMIANNPGALLTGFITPTTAALTTLGQFSSSDVVKLGVRKAAKEAKNGFREALTANIRRIAQRVAGEYGDPSPQVTSCFPMGREVFADCRDDLLDDHLAALVAALTALGTPMAATLGTATGLLTTWNALYAASEASTGAKTTSEAGKRAARAVVERQLTLNLLGLAAQFLDQPEKADLYFQQHLLNLPGAPEEEAPPVP